ncbi:MAG: flagellar protein FliT [Gammaproteobacteria bacterium]|jgi:flagellar protein FliT|uniref:flagellar protein FliT n=1 Tax=Polynucleobacter sp. 35-46-11 TaxID=1970425 RepID=UPI000BD5D688|nr:flagellar protein FliT [Polynucleobacter sp. 35-46-11]MBU0587861.1 flagellar protein FliT [Gammaproteobacteria bacterium]MBU0785896.1 flagellar protein FliT [Gammaproteobacteria bacterium]MBU0816509.1 flagellar protein FliT [Gammaproteobacteria bacterium]MBU1788310.1 flagellar protein FliT [Gammaproteobacteria bacterium]OYY06488.1 MAG: flagellar protein FliT [Polynucleobacter sp. 35-46-11]
MTKTLIDYYKAIEVSSRGMLDAAKAEDWEEVVRFEGVCAVLIEQLRVRAHSEELLPQQRLEKSKIMQRILHNDAQVRYLAEPWLAHLDREIGSQQVILH